MDIDGPSRIEKGKRGLLPNTTAEMEGSQAMTLTPSVSVYKVEQGDTLWDIAKEQYGDPNVWPEIKRANRLAKGNLILVGQKLKLPVINRPGSSGAGLSERKVPGRPVSSEAGMVARTVRTPALKLPLDEVSVTLPPGPVRITVTLKGEITFQEEDALVEVSPHGEFDFTALRTQVANKNSGLFSNGKVSFDLEKRTASLSIELAAAAKIDGKVFKTPTTGFAIIGPPDPGYKFTSEVEPIEGEWRGFKFEGTFGFEIEVHPNQQKASEVRVAVPAPSPGTQVFLLGAAVIVAATLILAPEIIPVLALTGEDSMAFAELFTVLGARAMMK